MSFELHHGDCLEIMPSLVERFDGIFTDIPYGTTACSWDVIIPLKPMWKQVKRLLKPNGAFITTASQPFTSVLVMSDVDYFHDEIIWQKTKATRHLDANRKPLKCHESILVFCDGNPTYNPQGLKVGKFKNGRIVDMTDKVYGQYNYKPISDFSGYPKTIIKVANPSGVGHKHPTQKPAALYEYLIRTYSNPGDTILDFAMGSGTTGVAAIRTGRHFVGIEKDAGYFKIAEQRISSAQPALFTEDESLLTPRRADLLRSGAAGAEDQLSMWAGDGDE